MDKIEDFRVGGCINSKYIKPIRISFKQNHENRTWDCFEEHDDVAIIVFNKSRNVLVVVKQFRPAIYISRVETEERDGETVVDTEKFPGSLGITYELCAGIVDKEHSTQEIAQMELLEECGYKVPLDNIERVMCYRSGVGTTGSLQTLFFAEVTDSMKVGSGGGVAEEGEMIDVVDIPVTEGREFIKDETKSMPLGVIFAFTWFYDNKYSDYKS